MLKKIEQNLIRVKSIENFIESLESRIQIPSSQNCKIVLFEMTFGMPRFIAYSFFLQYWKSQGYQAIAYWPKISPRSLVFTNRIIRFVLSRLNIDNGKSRPYRIMRALGCSSFIFAGQENVRYQDRDKQFAQVQRLSKSQLLSFSYREILIGDIFYDWHLNIRKIGTPKFASPEFRSDFDLFCRTTDWWISYFQQNDVKALHVSHTVYDQAIPVRVALSRGIQVFLVSGDRNYRITQENLLSDREYLYYEKDQNLQFQYEVSMERAEAAIHKLVNGDKDVDPAHAIVSGFEYSGRLSKNTELLNSNKNNVVVALHCFGDAPHANGTQLFPDFTEWMQEIGDLSLRTDFRWFIKPHPSFTSSDYVIMEEFLAEFPNFILLSPSDSNNLLIEKGADIFLSVHGTIAFETALMGTPTLSASTNAPYVKYDFSYIPSSVEEFRKYVKDIPNLISSFKPKRREILHYYDIHHLRSATHWIWGEQTSKVLEYVGGYLELPDSPKTLEYWLQVRADSSWLDTLARETSDFIEGEKYLHDFAMNDLARINKKLEL